DVSNMERVGDAFQANSVAFHPDGKTFLTAGYIRLWRWEVAGNAPPRTYETATEKRSTLVVDPNRKNVLLGVEEGTAKLWDANFSVRSEFADSDGFTAFYFSPDGRIAATNNRSNYYLRFWRTESGQIIGRLEESISQLQFSPDSQAFAALKGGNAVYIYDSQTVKLARTLRGHTQNITQIRFTRDGKLLISTGADKTVKVWDWRTGELLKTLAGLTAAPTSLALSPDSSTVAVAANDGNITLWEAATGTLKQSWSAGKIPHLVLAFSPDSKTLATATREAKTQLWDAATGQLRKTLAGDASQDFITSLEFSPDGQGLVLREEYQGRYTVKLWNLNSGQLVRRWQDGLEVRDISFSTDGKALLIAADLQSGASNARDIATKIYATATGELLADVIGFADGSWVVVTPDGLFDGVPASWVRLNWRFGATAVAPVEAFFNEFYYPGLLAELLSGKRPVAPRNLAQIDRRRPEIELRYADESASETVAARSVKLTLKVGEEPSAPSRPGGGGSGARDVRLFHNGALVKVFRGDALKGQKSVTLEASVSIVAGENRFTAYAFNRDNVKSDDATLLLRGDESLARKGIAYVLVIGLNTYANPQFNLRYAVADAQLFGAEFQQQQSRLAQFAEVKITPLFDAQATKSSILRQLANLAGQAQPEDAVIVFYAGHGVAAQNQFYLIPHDLGFMGRREAV
nr:caspase family protein [Pyrinomonadaceae bacterium]